MATPGSRYDSQSYGYDSDEEDAQQGALQEEADGDYSTEIDPGVDLAGASGTPVPIVPVTALGSPKKQPSPPAAGAGSPPPPSPATTSAHAPAPAPAQAQAAVGSPASPAVLSVPLGAAHPASPVPSASPYQPAAASPYAPASSYNAAAGASASPYVTPYSQPYIYMPRTPATGMSGAASAAGVEQQLASVIEHGIEFARASEHITQLQEQVELLRVRLVSAATSRDKAEEALREQAKQHEASRQQLRELYDARLSDQAHDYEAQLEGRAREVAALRARVAQLEEAGPKAKLLRSVDAKLSEDEVAALRREVGDQETLLKGYQQENEAAMKRIKELERALKEATMLHIPSHMSHDREREPTRPGTSGKEAAARLSEVLNLQQQLEALREASVARESELRAAIDKLRAEKRELEARKGGVDLAAMQEGDVLVKQVKGEMESMRGQYQGMVSELQAKLRWYAENQELLTKNDALVREQQDVIAQLEQRLAQWEGPQSKSAQQRMRELQAQVVALQQALKARVPPNSLAAIIEASKPKPEETAQVQALEARIAALQDKLSKKDEEYELELRAYQQRYEALSAQYEARQAKLEAAARARKKEKELAAQVEEQRAMYTKRIRDLEARLKQAQAGGSSLGGAGSTRRSTGAGEEQVAVSLLRQKEGEVRRLGLELERKTKQVAEMHLRLGEAEAKIVRLGEGLRRSTPGSPFAAAPPHPPSPIPSATPTKYGTMQLSAQDVGRAAGAQVDQGGAGLWHAAGQHGAVVVLQQQVAALGAECEGLRQQLAAARAAAEGKVPPAELAATRSEAEALRRRAEAADLALATMQRSYTEAVEKGANAAVEHQRAMLRLHDEVAYKEGVKWQERLSAAESEVRALRATVSQLEGEVGAAQERARAGWSPTASEFTALEAKLDGVCRELAARDAKWRGVLEDARSLYGVQMETARQKYEAQLAAKTAEVEAFKMQVDSLLVAAKRYMASSQELKGSA